MLLFRCRFLLEMTGHVNKLHPVHGPLLYALLAEAYGLATGVKPVLPAGLKPLAVEQLRVQLKKGDHYAFGVSLLSTSAAEAATTIEAIQQGLQKLGTRKGRQSLQGNFRLITIDDLFGQVPLQPGSQPQPLDGESLLQECQQAATLSQVTIHFITPLRWKRPSELKVTGQHFVNRDVFPPDQFLQRIPNRLQALGLDITGAPEDLQLEQAKLMENRLVWLEVDYKKARKRGMRLGGAVGRVVIKLPPNYPRHWLVWGQYVHVGESTNFDHGRYRIVELGDDPYCCKRSANLLELAFQKQNLERVAEDCSADSGQLMISSQQILQQEYTPPQPHQILLEKAGRKPRQLTVPPAEDRALQRTILEILAPGLEGLLETSSFAYRRGLSRHAAARHIQQLYKQNYRWAIQADFESFFDTIDHDELFDRLSAYLQDEPTTWQLMQWVQHADADNLQKGIPTGYPISPLLANLFLDRFDERIQQAGGRLIRYADDFLILFREQEQAEKFFATAEQIAAELLLKLNDKKTVLRDLTEPFEFLGFRFQQTDKWEQHPKHAPQHIDELGWHDLSKVRALHAPRVRLTGESSRTLHINDPVCILGNDITEIRYEKGHLYCQKQDGSTVKGPLLSKVEQILILGETSLNHSLIRELSREPKPLILCSSHGHPIAEWLPEDSALHADLLTAQVQLASDDCRRLLLSQKLIAAKLHNYATLADAYPDRKKTESISPKLRDLAMKACKAESINKLLGYEGAGAALWYQSLSGRLPRKFPLYRRTAPHARDPINVLLNIAQTHLYRQCRIAARLVGFSPSLGVLHQPKSGFSPLAADLQEPFRFLMDRAVIEAAFKIEHRDFTRRDGGHFPLQLSWKGWKILLGGIYENLKISTTVGGNSNTVSYHHYLLRTARSLRRVLKGDASEWNVFSTKRTLNTPQNETRK